MVCHLEFVQIMVSKTSMWQDLCCTIGALEGAASLQDHRFTTKELSVSGEISIESSPVSTKTSITWNLVVY